MGGKWADKHVPAHIRHLLAAECSCSDGAAFTFLFFAFYLMTDLPNVGDAIRDWLLILWLCTYVSTIKKKLLTLFFPRQGYSWNCHRFFPRLLLSPPNEVLSTS